MKLLGWLRKPVSAKRPPNPEMGHGVKGYLPVFDNAQVFVSTEEKTHLIGEERAWVASVPSYKGDPDWWDVLVYATSKEKARLEARRIVRKNGCRACLAGLRLKPAIEKDINQYWGTWTNR